jgi:hypothetical protein
MTTALDPKQPFPEGVGLTRLLFSFRKYYSEPNG